MGLRSHRPQPDSNHHPLLGPPLGKSRVLGRKDTNWLTNEVPGLSLKESATSPLTGSVVPGPLACCPPSPSREKPLQGTAWPGERASLTSTDRGQPPVRLWDCNACDRQPSFPQGLWCLNLPKGSAS